MPHEVHARLDLNQDYGIFIDTYICRKLGEKKDMNADLVINSIEIPKTLHIIYLKYKMNIITKLLLL